MIKNKKITSRLRKLSLALNSVESVIMIIGAIVMLVITIYAIICRDLLYKSAPWTDELVRYVFLYVSWIGMGYVTSKGTHIDVQLIDSLLQNTKNPQIAVNFVIRLSQVLVLVILTIITYLYLTFTLSRYPSLSTAMKIPMRIPYMSTFFGLILMWVHDLILLLLPLPGTENA